MRILPVPMLMTGLMLLADCAAIIFSGVTGVWIRYIFDGQFHPSLYWNLWPVGLFFLFVYASFGLYPGVLISAPEELKKASLATSFAFVTLGALTFISRVSEIYSRGIFIMGWAMLLFAVPVFRAACRSLFSRFHWWGYPVVIIGRGPGLESAARALQENARRGLRPVAAFGEKCPQDYMAGLPCLPLDEVKRRGWKSKHAMAFVVPDNEWSAECGDFFKNYLQGFYRIILLPNMMGLSSLWVATVDISGFLGLEIKQKLLDPKRKALKRGTDLLLAFCLSPFALPLLFILAAAVRLDSPGPVFFRQTRLGLGGRSIRIWKFRTMVRDADEQLERYLAERPDLRREWEQGQKIQKDPRVTRVGRFLRKTSLDELPQLWNVLKGDMSLVGPRPIIESEIARYRQTYALYTQVRPGVTGLWQVSGRNTLEYEQRVHLDAYYVRNWSLWLDIFILARTPMEVFRGRGAV